jgi:O-antigen ligase
VIGGAFAIKMLNIPFTYLLIDPTSITRKSFALGLYNYHWFAYQFVISLIFIFAIFMYIKNIIVRVTLILFAFLCVYFLLLSSSRQSIFGGVVALWFCFLWVEFSGTRAHRFWIVTLVIVVLISAYWLVEQAPNILRLGFLSSGTTLPDSALIREILQKRSQVSWEVGLALIPESPIWGLGFSKYYVSHNLFLGTIVDQGIVGLVFLVGFLLFWVGEAQQSWRTSAQLEDKTWKLAMVAVMVFVLVQSQFSGNPLSEWAMWWSTAFLWCLNGLDTFAEGQKQDLPDQASQPRLVR